MRPKPIRYNTLQRFRPINPVMEDLVEYTPEIEAQKAAAEAATTAQMAALFAPLSQTQLEAIVAGTNALVAASANAAP